MLFSSESVSEGHPDKLADQISDALLDHFLAYDSEAKVACETMVTKGLVVLAGEVHTHTYIDVEEVARKVISRVGYHRDAYKFSAHSCGVISMLHEQSNEIYQAVKKSRNEEQGAGDQGMMFGYAVNETDNLMPLPIALSHRIVRTLAELRRESSDISYLRPDAKVQVTVEYDNQRRPMGVHTIVISTQHDAFASSDSVMQAQIARDIKKILMPRVLDNLPQDMRHYFGSGIQYYINPSGRFVLGGPYSDTGLTGRKTIVDTYGGMAAHGGGAFSGKDPSKVDRSAAYMMRYVAKHLVSAGVADRVLIQVAYAIGQKKNLGLYIYTFGTAKVKLSDSQIAEKTARIFDLSPWGIEKTLRLRQPMYEQTACYGHVGQPYRRVKKRFERLNQTKEMDVELFTWENLDSVEEVRKAFGC